jgi:hypothetical protein
LWHFDYTPQIASGPLLVSRQHQHEYKAKLRTGIGTNSKINRYDNAVRCGAASITVLSVVILRYELALAVPKSSLPISLGQRVGDQC